MDLVSIIIPSYNRFKYVLNAIQSMKEQTYKHIEIIVVNDCSTEKEYYTYDWASNNIIILHLEKNTQSLFGFPCAGYVRNKGIELSRGKYIGFCDDDDVWLPNKLELQLDAMKETNCKFSATEGFIGNGVFDKLQMYKKYNSEYYFSTIQSIYTSAGSDKMIHNYPRIWDYDFLRIHNCVITSSVVIEKELITQIGNMKNVPNGREDYEYWLEALKYTNLVYVPYVCFYYDMGHGGRNEKN